MNCLNRLGALFPIKRKYFSSSLYSHIHLLALTRVIIPCLLFVLPNKLSSCNDESVLNQVNITTDINCRFSSDIAQVNLKDTGDRREASALRDDVC